MSYAMRYIGVNYHTSIYYVIIRDIIYHKYCYILHYYYYYYYYYNIFCNL